MRVNEVGHALARRGLRGSTAPHPPNAKLHSLAWVQGLFTPVVQSTREVAFPTVGRALSGHTLTSPRIQQVR